jgi:hypothetical protein
LHPPEIGNECRTLNLERETLRAWNKQNHNRLPVAVAEAALALITLERILRVAIGPRGKGKTLRTLLLQATDQKSGFLTIEGREEGVRVLANLRNLLLHGDFEASGEPASTYLAQSLVNRVAHAQRITDSFLQQLAK